ncbi:hypothetical protein BDV37DRAFT_291368 [Aspergillus pseudonomiae]|uniref:Uncharacterized protein n=1 Tax=Aspergillus pseudonomiae TaxID=1506151 RepID=A0A5N7DNT6_9EURO|nr:uncharacterized protein BDV37DRAFT_291368 [Aspergillus pseudonomiae]KAE8407138.1 hypothetical protein BDV37DRAFT_291368 [Aspergillus pseudonomiae]
MFLLNSSDPIAFFLGLGVQIIFSGQRISSSMHLKPDVIAHALHGIVANNIRSDEQINLFVTACTAKEGLYLDIPETEETEEIEAITTLRRFFDEIIAINTLPLQPSNELREYARLRFRMFNHRSSMRLVFPAPINILLVLHDIEALVVEASMPESLSKDDTVRKLSEKIASTAGFLRLLTRDLWVESPEALKCVTGKFNLYGQMVMVSQGLEMAINIGQLSAFDGSLSVFRESLKQQIEDMRVFCD